MVTYQSWARLIWQPRPDDAVTRKQIARAQLYYLPLAHVLPVPLDAQDEVHDVEQVVKVLYQKKKLSECVHSWKTNFCKDDLW